MTTTTSLLLCCVSAMLYCFDSLGVIKTPRSLASKGETERDSQPQYIYPSATARAYYADIHTRVVVFLVLTFFSDARLALLPSAAVAAVAFVLRADRRSRTARTNERGRERGRDTAEVRRANFPALPGRHVTHDKS